MKSKREKYFRLTSFIVGIVFILSGIFKSVNVYSFANTILQYTGFLMWDFLYGYQLGLAVLICCGEILIGLLSLHPHMSIFTGFVYFPVLLFFSIITGLNYFEPYAQIESCGCFGEVIHMSPLASFIKSIVLLGMASFMLYFSIDSFRNHNVIKKFLGHLPYSYLSVGFIVSLGIPLMSLIWVNRMEHSIYLLSFSSVCISTMSIIAYLIFNKRFKRV